MIFLFSHIFTSIDHETIVNLFLQHIIHLWMINDRKIRIREKKNDLTSIVQHTITTETNWIVHMWIWCEKKLDQRRKKGFLSSFYQWFSSYFDVHITSLINRPKKRWWWKKNNLLSNNEIYFLFSWLKTESERNLSSCFFFTFNGIRFFSILYISFPIIFCIDYNQCS